MWLCGEPSEIEHPVWEMGVTIPKHSYGKTRVMEPLFWTTAPRRGSLSARKKKKKIKGRKKEIIDG